MHDKIHDLKSALYELIEEVAAGATKENANNADVQLQQNMGVNLSNAIKRDGVNIIQIQSMQINRIIPKIIDCLKIIDDVDYKKETIEYKPMQQIENDIPKNNDAPFHLLFEFFEYSYSNNFDCQKITDFIKVGYSEFLKEILFKFKDVLDFMGISQTVIYGSKSRLSEVKLENDNDDIKP